MSKIGLCDNHFTILFIDFFDKMFSVIDRAL